MLHTTEARLTGFNSSGTLWDGEWGVCQFVIVSPPPTHPYHVRPMNTVNFPSLQRGAECLRQLQGGGPGGVHVLHIHVSNPQRRSAHHRVWDQGSGVQPQQVCRPPRHGSRQTDTCGVSRVCQGAFVSKGTLQCALYDLDHTSPLISLSILGMEGCLLVTSTLILMMMTILWPLSK